MYSARAREQGPFPAPPEYPREVFVGPGCTRTARHIAVGGIPGVPMDGRPAADRSGTDLPGQPCVGPGAPAPRPGAGREEVAGGNAWRGWRWHCVRCARAGSPSQRHPAGDEPGAGGMGEWGVARRGWTLGQDRPCRLCGVLAGRRGGSDRPCTRMFHVKHRSPEARGGGGPGLQDLQPGCAAGGMWQRQCTPPRIRRWSAKRPASRFRGPACGAAPRWGARDSSGWRAFATGLAIFPATRFARPHRTAIRNADSPPVTLRPTLLYHPVPVLRG